MRLASPATFTVLVLLCACGPKSDDDGGTDGGSGEEETGSGSSSSGSAGSSSTSSVTSSASTTAATSSSSGGSSESSSEGEAGEASSAGETGNLGCGTVPCDGDSYCDWIMNSCGEREYDQVTCEPTPGGCDRLYAPVCGCDGQVHGNECVAHSMGVDLDAEGACTPPEGTFACGYRFCDLAGSYCRFSPTDALPSPDGYECVPLPDGCGDTPGCECLAEEPCADFGGCEPVPGGGLQIICPGG